MPGGGDGAGGGGAGGGGQRPLSKLNASSTAYTSNDPSTPALFRGYRQLFRLLSVAHSPSASQQAPATRKRTQRERERERAEEVPDTSFESVGRVPSCNHYEHDRRRVPLAMICPHESELTQRRVTTVVEDGAVDYHHY